jgi:hypothetical protein
VKFEIKKIVDLIRAALLTPVITANPMDALKERKKIKDEEKPAEGFWLKMSQNLILTGSRPLVLHLKKLESNLIEGIGEFLALF